MAEAKGATEGMDPTGQGWNVLIIESDEHNPKIMGCAGNAVVKTPAMDRLAHEGTLFTKAYCAFPACAPTRQSMITGKFPQEHGQISNPSYFDERNKTWADHFKSHGYTTACIGKMHTNNEWNNHGFDYRFGPLDFDRIMQGRPVSELWKSQHSDKDEKEIFDLIPPQNCREMFQAEILDDPSFHRDNVWLEEALRYLEEVKDKKFFVHVSFTDPHWPWNTPEDFFYMYDPDTIDLPEIIPGDLDDDRLPYRMYKSCGWDCIPEEAIRLSRAKYYSSVSYTDYYVKQILDRVDELGLTEKTLVIYTSDHGDMAGEKGLWFKDMFFDGAARTPLIMRMPGVIPQGGHCSELVSHVDIFPTIASLVGASDKLPTDITGEDMSRAVLGEPQSREYIFCVYRIDQVTLKPGAIMVRSSRWKLIRYDLFGAEPEFVLYDMDNDPDEIINHAYNPEYSEVVSRHNRAIDSFLAGLKLTDIPPREMFQIG